MRSNTLLVLCIVLSMMIRQSNGDDDFQQVGIASDGKVAFEYIGVVKQNGFDFTTFGYFTRIHGVPDSLLFFAGAQRDHRNARFTFLSESKMVSRSIVNKVFSLGIEGNMVVYIRRGTEKEANLEDAKGFDVGDPIATMDVRGQSVISVTAPNVGVNSAVLELKQTKEQWKGFTDGKGNYTFGQPNSEFRLNHIGHGERLQPEPPIATITIAGHAVSVGSSSEP